MEHKTIFLVDLDAFFASVEEARNPELKNRPVCIGGNAQDRGVVACPNYAARRLGVRTAMPLRTAASILRNANAVFLRGNHKLYGEYSKKVFDILYQFTPDIEQVSLDEGYLDVTDCLHLWNNDSLAMAHAMKDRVKNELSLSLSVGIASNKVCAKIASDLHKPDGCVLVPAGGETEFLAHLPVEKLPGVGKKTLEKFRGVGIRTIGDLARTPEENLAAMIGQWGRYLHRHACGIDESVVQEPGEEKSISRATTFSEDTRNREFIESVLFYLVERCCRTLRRRKVAAMTVSVDVRFSDFTNRRKQCTRKQPSNIEEEIYSDVLNILPELLKSSKSIRLVGVGLSNFQSSEQQTGLFDDHSSKLASLSTTIDKIREKYGYQIITVGRTADLKKKFKGTKDGFELHTPSLSK